MARLQLVQRIDWNFAPATEERLPLAAGYANARRPFLTCILITRRHRANRGDARIHEHDLLARRGVGVQFLVFAMKALLDPVDQIGAVPVETIERYVDLEDLLAVAHFGRPFDRHRSLEP